MTDLYENIHSLEEFQALIEKVDAALIYFSHEQCNVCKMLKPKVTHLLQDQFPKMKMVYADTVKSPEIAGQNRVFAVPTIVVFIAGKESFRRSRNIGVSELADLIERPYKMIFDE
jgi:thioredoxin-like negative regulator of GroEL